MYKRCTDADVICAPPRTCAWWTRAPSEIVTERNQLRSFRRSEKEIDRKNMLYPKTSVSKGICSYNYSLLSTACSCTYIAVVPKEFGFQTSLSLNDHTTQTFPSAMRMPDVFAKWVGANAKKPRKKYWSRYQWYIVVDPPFSLYMTCKYTPPSSSLPNWPHKGRQWTTPN